MARVRTSRFGLGNSRLTGNNTGNLQLVSEPNSWPASRFMQVYSAIPDDSVRSDQGFIREVFLDRHEKKMKCHKSPGRPELLIPIHRTKRDERMYFRVLPFFPGHSA